MSAGGAGRMEPLAAGAALLEAARRAGAEAADVLVVEETSLGVGVAGGALEEAERSEGTELGLRVLIGPRQACIAASDTRPETLAAMAERAVAMAREAPEDPYCGLADPGQLGRAGDPAALDLCDPSAPPEPARLEALAHEAEAAALAVRGVGQVEQARASWGRERVTLLATNGIDHTVERTLCAVSASAIAGEALGRERDYAVEIRRHWADLPGAGTVGQRAGERAVAALGARKPRAGRFPVVYDERVSGGLIGHLLGAINAASVARGSSWLADAMGEAVLPAGLDLVEDPLVVRGRASRVMDAEGLPTPRRRLVAGGRLETWLLDLATARQLGLESTGHARRGTGGPPRPGTSNIRLTEGAQDRAGLLAQMGTGLLVTSLIGSSINPTTGDYSRGASGFWVEGGEIVHPVNEITIAGNLRAMLLSLVPANDADPHKTVSVPSLLVDGLTIGA